MAVGGANKKLVLKIIIKEVYLLITIMNICLNKMKTTKIIIHHNEGQIKFQLFLNKKKAII